MIENVIEIRNLTKDYTTGFWRKKKVRALDDLTLDVRGGQIFGFLGGNGAGKTTTIKTLMRLQFPSAGSAAILGRDISDVQMHTRIGYCPENPYFYDYLSARELMDYFGCLFGYDAASRREKTEHLLTSVGLEEKDWKKELRKYSKGMLQRVGLAQALINDPELVILDEPMSGLDPVGRRHIRELIAGLREKGVTVFMSTHILSDIEALCDEVAILRSGRLTANGPLIDLLAKDDAHRALEIVVQGLDAESIREKVEFISGAILMAKPTGAIVEVADDTEVEAVLKITREAGGHLIAVRPVKQSLEELFVKETTAEP
jgi:ABC-2 type transport system ATP-binding protein